MEEDDGERDKRAGAVKVSLFDHSVENHFNAMAAISKLSGEADSEVVISQNDAEFKRLASSITFLREWKDFHYKQRVIKFPSETTIHREKDDPQAILLPQFSSATVPNNDAVHGDAALVESSKDFVMNVGGSVWALDWCRRDHQKFDCPVKLEFLAVAAHPPESYYHKLGAVLTGRGLVQIWCVLNPNGNKEEVHAPLKRCKQRAEFKEGDKLNEFKKPRGRPRKTPIENITKPKRPKGRPRKKPINESPDSLDNSLCAQALVVEYPEEPSGSIATEGGLMTTQEQGTKVNKGRKRKTSNEEASASIPVSKTKPVRKLKSKAEEKENQRGISGDAGCPPLLTQDEEKTKQSSNSEDAACPPLLTQNKEEGSSTVNHQIPKNSEQEMVMANSVLNYASLDASSASCLIPNDVALPRVVLCLAHNGKVAWDVKWRPYDKFDSFCQYRMGFLAVLLGNGSLEVWDVPFPHAVKSIYSSASCRDGVDPRFVKLEPVFRCSHLKLGETLSIPLTVEWSTSCFQDYLLAGCHDGMVALWKFSTSETFADARPLLFFSADTNPIRAVSWAPMESDQEGANIIATAGLVGLKFWDIRDPFRPLWDIHSAPRICSMDWLPHPRCIIFSCDDGTMKLLSLVKAAYESHLDGKPPAGTKQGLHMFNCSSSSIWDVQVSRLTGMVAYCSADGTVKRFQLTRGVVEKDASRHRTPHFMCGSLGEDESGITVFTPAPDIPLNLKKPVKDGGEALATLPDQDKRTNANIKVSDTDNKILALCYGNDPSVGSEDDETLAFLSRKSRQKSKKISKEKAAEDQPLMCRDEEFTNLSEKQTSKGGAQTDIETFPSKIVAMNRVRWNMNKGSERWLCFGGAAGIVRCQEIIMSDLDMKLARKR